MCTVTYLPNNNGDFIFTSSRDEEVQRKTLAPEIYTKDETRFVYPKDLVGGGTWIATSDQERLVCLLNGAYEAHDKKKTYGYSRGLVVKEILEAENVKWAIEDIQLNDIEPFTLIAIDWSFLPICIELIWDGVKKDIRILSHSSKIWSSSTLYDKKVKIKREEGFKEFGKEFESPKLEEILGFHKALGIEDISEKMQEFKIQTTSFTSVIKNGDAISMYYLDVLTGDEKLLDVLS
jgi:hypothetical protein